MGVDAVALAILAYVMWTYAIHVAATYKKEERKPLADFFMLLSLACALASLVNVIWDVWS